jgi:hypothetical protein
MANYRSIKLAISEIPLSSIKVGSCTLVTFPTPPSPDPPYVFTFYKGSALSIADIPLTAIKIGIMAGVGHIANNSIKIGMSDLPDMSNLKVAVLRSVEIIRYGNMAIRVYFKNFSLG